MMYNWSPKPLIEYNIMLRKQGDYKTQKYLVKYLTIVSLFKNLDNYQFRSLFNIENTPPMNRRSIGTSTFSIVIQNSYCHMITV